MRLAVIVTVGALVGIGGSVAIAQTAPPDPNVELAEKLRDQLYKERKANVQKVRRAYAIGKVHAFKQVLERPDAEVSLQVAGIVYGQDWRQIRSCWLSEGYRNAERFNRSIPRDNTTGSGATGPAQFMPSTYASTPFARLHIHNVLAQAMATGWMWSVGRRGEWAGKGC